MLVVSMSSVMLFGVFTVGNTSSAVKDLSDEGLAPGVRRLPTSDSLYNIKTKPLRKMALRPVAKGARVTRALPKPKNVRDRNEGRPKVKPPTTRPSGLPNPQISFEGVPNVQNVMPPDTTGEVGPNHYVQAVNFENMAIFDKSGNLLLGPFKISTLWQGVGDSCELAGRGDPIIQYDNLARRWVITQFAFTKGPGGQNQGPFYQCIAVSTTSDPTGAYFAYSFLLSQNTFPDFPKFGVWPDAYYMTAHLFAPNNGAFSGLGVVAYEREEMLAGRPARFVPFESNQQFWGMLPADVSGGPPPPTGSPNYLVVVQDDVFGHPADHILMYEFHADWLNPNASAITGPTALVTAPFDSNLCNGNRNCIPQPGGAPGLDPLAASPAGGTFLNYPLSYRSFRTHESLVFNHSIDATGTDRAGIAWYELRNPPDPFILQQGLYAPDAHNRWMASISQDAARNMAIGFSVSSTTAFPSIGYTGRLNDDPLGTMAQGEVPLIVGGGVQTGGNRWGDYSQMSIDPTNDCTFWYTNEYMETTSQMGWRTRIAAFKFPSCPDRINPRLTGVRDTPDPFLPARGERSRIFWNLPEDAKVKVSILNAAGKEVRKLGPFSLYQGTGWFTNWNGRNKARNLVPPGRYTYQIVATDPSRNRDTAQGGVTVAR